MRVASSFTLVTALVIGAVAATAGPAAPAPPGWAVIPSRTRPAPAGGTLGAGLNGVACPTNTSCVVVGAYDDTDFTRPLAGQRRGSSWSIVAAPVPTFGYGRTSQLSAVACVARDRCYAVGALDDGGGARALVELWNGYRWSIVPNPKMPGTTGSSLSGIACPATTSCFAVGSALGPGGAEKTLIEHWNGK